MPLADEQINGAIIAYKEGALDYVSFLQNTRDAIKIEVDSWTAFKDYFTSRYQLAYYLKSTTTN